jgi:nitroreductase
VRLYETTPVSDELVDSWLETARWCGSSRNSQPWRFVVVRDAGTKRALAGLGDHAAHLAAAPVVVAVAAVEGPFPFSTAFDLGRVSHSLQLAAHADGVGSCIAVFEPAENIRRGRRILSVPDDLRLDVAIGFGRPAPPGREGVEPAERVSRPGRVPLSALVSRERYDGSSSSKTTLMRGASKNGGLSDPLMTTAPTVGPPITM